MKTKKITMTRTPEGYDTFGPDYNDGRVSAPRFIVYRPARATGHDPDRVDVPFALLDRGDTSARVVTVTLGARQFVGVRTYWETKREIREEYSTVEMQQAVGILPAPAAPTDAPVRFTDRDEAATTARALARISGMPFTVIGDGPEHGTVWIVALAAGPGVA